MTKPKLSIKGTIDSDLHLKSSNYALDNLYLRFHLFSLSILVQLTTLLDLLGFVYYNEIRDRVGGEGSKDGEVGGEVIAEERRGNDDERGDVGGGDVGDCSSEGMVDFRTVVLISSPPLSLLFILSRQLAKSLGRPSLIRYKRAKDG